MSLFGQPIRPALVCLLLGLATFALILANPQGLQNPSGTGNGQYADLGDSFSESIVRNTTIRNATIPSDPSILPIIAKGYAAGDYHYYPDHYTKYYTNLSLQTLIFGKLAVLLKFNDQNKIEYLFTTLRLINLFLFSIFTSYFALNFCIQNNLKSIYAIPILLSFSAGFILYGQNLYFLSATMVAPAALISGQLSRTGRFSWAAVFALGFCYFLRQYELATVFALLTAFSAALFTASKAKARAKNALIAFSAILAAFLVTACLHVLIVFADSQMTLSLRASFALAFQTATERTLSLSHAPAPFTRAFFAAMELRWEQWAFRIAGHTVQISERNLLLVMLALVPVIAWRRKPVEITILLYGFAGYVSWYIFAYQHIIVHAMYDWYIFALTIGLSFSLLALIALDALGARITRWWRGTPQSFTRSKAKPS